MPEHRLQYPIQLVPTAKIQYEQIKVGFNPIAMLLGNPMYLLMGGMAVFMMIMPKVSVPAFLSSAQTSHD
jgi:hypothetical protein